MNKLVDTFSESWGCRGVACDVMSCHVIESDSTLSYVSVTLETLKSYKSVNPNTIKSYKILQKLSPKHAAHSVAQSPYTFYRHRKACLSKQPPWRAAPDPRLARGRSRVRAPGPAGALRALFFSTLPSFLLREIVFSHLSHQTHESVRVNEPSRICVE